jgi:transposase
VPDECAGRGALGGIVLAGLIVARRDGGCNPIATAGDLRWLVHFPDSPGARLAIRYGKAAGAIRMSQGARVLRPERGQLRWEMVDLDSQLPPEHRARLVWAFVTGLDLSEFYARIKARDEQAGRPASDPAVLLALWLYATLEGVGAARALARLCDYHAAYRWLCGGVPVNHDLLSAFRRESGAVLDGLLTRSLTSLIAEGLITLDEVAIDGTKVRARAGRGSLAQRPKLERIEAEVSKRVAALKQELEQDAGAAERKRRERALRSAEEQAERVKRAQQRLGVLEREKAERAKQHAKAEAAKNQPAVSVSDPEVRSMRMPDRSVQPAWNVQVATANGFIVAIEPTDRRNDSGLAPDTLAQVERRCGMLPGRVLADGTAITQDDIEQLSQRKPGLLVYSPPPQEREDVTRETKRKRLWKRRREPEAVKEWRERMETEAGKEVYRRRKLTERAHAQMKNRGFARMLVHGIAKVRAVCLLHALAHNFLQAGRLRAAAAAAS